MDKYININDTPLTLASIPKVKGTNINYSSPSNTTEWFDDGYRIYTHPEYDSSTHKLGELIYDEVNEVGSRDIVPLSQQEIDEYNENIALQPIEDEYSKYIERKEKGIEMYLKQSAQLRLAKSTGTISELEHQTVEDALRPVRDEIVLGQWLTARKLLVALGPETLGTTFYNSILTEADEFIEYSYGITYE